MNKTFGDTTATVHEVGAGTPGKIAWRATFSANGRNTLMRGIMRANSAGGLNCCEQRTGRTGIATLKDCPVLSWWAADGSHECWAPVNTPSEPLGACGE